jgi:hypothetical protein
MKPHRGHATIFVILALAGCVQAAMEQGQPPFAPYPHNDDGRMDRPVT